MSRGRCIFIKKAEGYVGYVGYVGYEGSVTIRSEQGAEEIPYRGADLFAVGDLIEVDKDGWVRLITSNRLPGGSSPWQSRILDPRRTRALKTRSRVESGIREFFGKKDFIETRTPLLVPCPGMEPHLRPMKLRETNLREDVYLPTSPEFAMKRLLVGGLEKIFQICPSFRAEPFSDTHHPEFTMLEWYRAYSGYEQIMKDTEDLFETLAQKIHGRATLIYGGREILLETPWPRMRVQDLFQQVAKVNLITAYSAPLLAEECHRLGLQTAPNDTWDDLYFRIWLNLIEPALPVDRPVIVYHYPPSQAALAVLELDPEGNPWAKRFEVYAGGLELGNAFEELTDPVEQRQRFTKDMELRERAYGKSFEKTSLDEGFLSALEEGMPPSGGIAMGVDRMVMLFADEPEIDYTLWLPSYWPTAESAAD